ncbi:mercuric transport protein MerTP [Flavobacteriaceae bacterium 14752]|uniref:mercuric transport protein MerTP n=1 Tax=Mesohalobacter salilacus TaxID=2491711 RepID=UPI000F6363C3|nr:mercuric transport protein MerTP [Flavobacteriaceae bacterium 14752]
MSKNSNKAKTTGLIAALAASSCCIPPVIAALAGIGGIAGSLSWMETYRPYLIAVAIIAIGYAWYTQLRPKKADDCCAIDDKPKWYQTKGFLVGITIFASFSIAFPYYSSVFYSSEPKKEIVIVKDTNIQSVNFKIDGMTCTGCATHVESEVNKLPGIIKIKASFKNANAVVEFDQSKVDVKTIKETINNTGYKITSIKN